MKIMRRFARDRAFWFDVPALVVAAVLFSLLPGLVSGIPLHRQLLSDAEFYAVVANKVLQPALYPRDQSFDFSPIPAGELAVHAALVKTGQTLHLETFVWSVAQSIASLCLFIVGVYVLMRASLQRRADALLVAAALIVPVHTLGGTTLGFQALGFLPRDLALAFVPWILLGFLKADTKPGWLLGIAAACGLLTNYYIGLFPHVCATLLLADAIRSRRIRAVQILAGLIFLALAAPTLIGVLATNATPVPRDILRERLGYLMAWPLPDAIARYLRRFLIDVAVVGAAWFTTRRAFDDRRTLAPWFAIAAAALPLSIVGVYLETATPHVRYLLSRTSLLLMLAAMPIVCVAARGFVRRLSPGFASTAGLVLAGAFFLIQSNVPSIYRFLRNARDNRVQWQQFLDASDRLRSISQIDALVLAPSSESNDLAASLRLYGQRSVFVAYKDGGIAIADGDRALRWRERYKMLQRAIDATDASELTTLMRREGIDYALVPDRSPIAGDVALRTAIADRPPGFVIVRRP